MRPEQAWQRYIKARAKSARVDGFEPEAKRAWRRAFMAGHRAAIKSERALIADPLAEVMNHVTGTYRAQVSVSWRVMMGVREALAEYARTGDVGKMTRTLSEVVVDFERRAARFSG